MEFFTVFGKISKNINSSEFKSELVLIKVLKLKRFWCHGKWRSSFHRNNCGHDWHSVWCYLKFDGSSWASVWLPILSCPWGRDNCLPPGCRDKEFRWSGLRLSCRATCERWGSAPGDHLLKFERPFLFVACCSGIGFLWLPLWLWIGLATSLPQGWR